MKNLFLALSVALLFSFTACSQPNKDVSQTVKSAFSTKFPDATKVKWDKENDKLWEAEFKKDGKEYSANFDVKGNWIETEYGIENSEIPLIVKSAIDKEFSNNKILESEISETTKGEIYEFEIKAEKVKYEAAFDFNGKFIKKEIVTKEEDND